MMREVLLSVKYPPPSTVLVELFFDLRRALHQGLLLRGIVDVTGNVCW